MSSRCCFWTCVCLPAITMLSHHENLQYLSPTQARSLPADSPSAWNFPQKCLLREGPRNKKVSVFALTTFRRSHTLYLIVLCLSCLSPFSKYSFFIYKLSQVFMILENSVVVINANDSGIPVQCLSLKKENIECLASYVSKTPVAKIASCHIFNSFIRF